MTSARDNLEQAADHVGRSHRSPAAGSGHTTARLIAGPADPRLLHGAGGGIGVLALQRSAGNAAVSSLVAPTLQRDVDKEGVDASAIPADAGPADMGVGGDSDGPVTSAGGTTSINGSTISLNAPMTESAGVIRADTIIANTVIGSSYTPGAGNLS